MHRDHSDLLDRVSRPARYTNQEWNAVRKDHAQARARFVLAYPDVYEVGMSHLGLHILCHVLNSHPDYLAERTYAPWVDMEAELRRAGLPLVSLESRTPLREFDVLGVTLPFELTYTNILTILELGGIPLRAAERADDDPLVVAGGPAAPNPEPLADFLDAIVLGDGEEVILEIAAAAADTRGRPRAERLRALARIEGVYVPSLYEVEYDPDGALAAVRPLDGAPEVVSKRIVSDLDGAPFPTRQIVPFLECVHERAVLEVMRGCGRGCRFCQGGMTYRPPRHREVETLLAAAEEVIRATGYDEISLLGFNSLDYPHIEELVDRLTERWAPERVNISLPSMRVDAFSVHIATRLSSVRRAGITFAPEAGTERLRRVIHKPITDEDLFSAAQAVFAAGWTGLKLYFMIGLPTETDEDVEALADLVLRLADFGRHELGARRGRLRISASVGNFCPKSHTPLQWWGQDGVEELERKQSRLRERLRAPGVRLSWNSARASRLEAAFSRGDRRLGAVLERAYRLGCRFDAWDERFQAAVWERAFADVGADIAFWANRRIPWEETLPWDHLAAGPSKAFGRREAEAAVAASVEQVASGAHSADR